MPHTNDAQVIPSDGITSMSLWDSTDRPGLERWLADNLGTDCTTKLHEVWHWPSAPIDRLQLSPCSSRHADDQ